MRCRRVQESNMGRLKGQLLRPLLFFVFINGLLRVITAIPLIFTDDVKMVLARSQSDRAIPHKSQALLMAWTFEWTVPSHPPYITQKLPPKQDVAYDKGVICATIRLLDSIPLYYTLVSPYFEYSFQALTGRNQRLWRNSSFLITAPGSHGHCYCPFRHFIRVPTWFGFGGTYPWLFLLLV